MEIGASQTQQVARPKRGILSRRYPTLPALLYYAVVVLRTVMGGVKLEFGAYPALPKLREQSEWWLIWRLELSKPRESNTKSLSFLFRVGHGLKNA